MRRFLFAPAAALLVSACAATPPAHWAQGGTALDLPHARWTRGDAIIDVMPDGKVYVDGEHELSIDRGGRVFDPSAEPIALLEPDGRLVGNDDTPLGLVGAMHASLPGQANAWLTVLEHGEVVRYDDEGERHGFGIWAGCDGSARTHQTCTLVSHLLGLRVLARESRGRVSIGVGVGVGARIR